MYVLLAISAVGLACGFLLLRRIPTLPTLPSGQREVDPKGCTSHEVTARAEDPANRSSSTGWQGAGDPSGRTDISVIIPARNEGANLPALLASLTQSQPPPAQVLVADDGSTDNTRDISASFGTTVLTVPPASPGWRGKNWACHQGSLAATSSTMLFLDADTRFEPHGLARTLSFFQARGPASALSILPFHITEKPYEELSLFFNLLTAIGAGGFTGLDHPSLFGQSLLISRDLYDRAGGHTAVRHHILENLHLAPHIRSAGGQTHTLSGRGALSIRMFPHGLAQLRESWEKAFSDGASATSPLALALSIYWLSAAAMTFLLAIACTGPTRLAALLLYLLFAVQIAWFSRQIGTFRFTTAVLYPIPLLFYFVIFGRSAWLRRFKRPTTWKGRQL